MRSDWNKLRAMSRRDLILRIGTAGAVAGIVAWLFALAPSSISQLLVFTALATIVLALTARTAADILVVGFCQWCKAMGGGLGCLVGSLHRRHHGREARCRTRVRA